MSVSFNNYFSILSFLSFHLLVLFVFPFLTLSLILLLRFLTRELLLFPLVSTLFLSLFFYLDVCPWKGFSVAASPPFKTPFTFIFSLFYLPISSCMLLLTAVLLLFSSILYVFGYSPTATDRGSTASSGSLVLV